MSDIVAFFALLMLCQPPGVHVGQCRVGTSNYVYENLKACEEAAEKEAVRASSKGFVVIVAECRPLIISPKDRGAV